MKTTPTPQMKTTAPVSKQKFQITCDCGFVVASHDRNETVNVANNHVGNKHKEMKVTTKDLEAKIKTI